MVCPPRLRHTGRRREASRPGGWETKAKAESNGCGEVREDRERRGRLEPAPGHLVPTGSETNKILIGAVVTVQKGVETSVVDLKREHPLQPPQLGDAFVVRGNLQRMKREGGKPRFDVVRIKLRLTCMHATYTACDEHVMYSVDVELKGKEWKTGRRWRCADKLCLQIGGCSCHRGPARSGEDTVQLSETRATICSRLKQRNKCRRSKWLRAPKQPPN